MKPNLLKSHPTAFRTLAKHMRRSFVDSIRRPLALAGLGAGVALAVAQPVTNEVLLLGEWPGYVRGWANAVAVSGRYAYVATLPGLTVLDVADPLRPLRVGWLSTGDQAYGVQVVGTTAYVAAGLAGLQILDVGNPANVVQLGRYDTSGTAWGVQVVGTTAYVADGEAGVQILDVSNPTNVVRLGGYNTIGTARGVQVAGTTAYVADYNTGLQILDVSNPARVVRLGWYRVGGYASGVQVVGMTAYVADGGAGLQILDVRNPANAVQLGRYDTSGTARGVQVVGTTAYVADGEAGVQILDVSNPTNVVRLGGYDTSGTAWGVHLAGTTAYVADGEAGLAILELTGRFTQTLTFDLLADLPEDASPIALRGVANSGLEVAYRIVNGPAVITNGHWLVVTGVGTVTVRAEQPGNALFAPAVAVDRTFQVTPPLSLEALVAAWIAGNYPGIPEAQRGPLADPDDDGAPNGLEYFFGGHPALADAEAVRLPPGMVAVEPDGRRSWVVIFALGPEVPDSLPWTIEQTASLTQRSWTPVPAGSIRRNGRQVELRLPITQASLFLRLRL